VSDVACDAELRIPSDLVYLRPVRVFIRELAESVGFGHKRVSDIELAVDEVFSNAIEHGSADSGAWIAIRCSSTDEMMRVVVSDTGRGRDSDTTWLDAWSDVIREEARSGTERGHGLLLVHNLTDEMRMESNSMGGVDVHLVVYKEGQRVAQK
jgi:anti-sigma regulatory factor (Ser/Thr protein kinase)